MEPCQILDSKLMVRVIFLIIICLGAVLAQELPGEGVPVGPIEPGLYEIAWAAAPHVTKAFVYPANEGSKTNNVLVITQAEIQQFDTALYIYYMAKGYKTESGACHISSINVKIPEFATIPRGVWAGGWVPDSFKFIIGGVNFVEILDNDNNGSTGKVVKYRFGGPIYRKSMTWANFIMTDLL